MNALKEFFQLSAVKKALALMILIGVLYSLSNLLNIFLFTFIFSYLFYSLHLFLSEKMKGIIKIHPAIFAILIYGLFAALIIIVGIRYVPPALEELINIIKQIASFNIRNYQDMVHPKVYEMITKIDVQSYFKEGEKYIFSTTKGIGTFLGSLISGFILSFFFALEREKIAKFMDRLKQSKVGFIFEYYSQFGRNFVHTFGKVLELQVLISLINCILSMIALFFLGFPNVWGLGLMIFIFGLVPVAGVIVSLIPLSIIAFQIGGWIKIIHVLIMIGVLHGLESYVLNPKLMSQKVKIPVFLTFLVLIVSEHTIGIWGLLVGIPLFMFILDILSVPQESLNYKKK